MNKILFLLSTQIISLISFGQSSLFEKGDTIFYARVQTDFIEGYSKNCYNEILFFPKSQFSKYIDTNNWERRQYLDSTISYEYIDDTLIKFKEYNYKNYTIRHKYKNQTLNNQKIISHYYPEYYDWFSLLVKTCDTNFKVSYKVKKDSNKYEINEIYDFKQLHRWYEMVYEMGCFHYTEYPMIYSYHPFTGFKSFESPLTCFDGLPLPKFKMKIENRKEIIQQNTTSLIDYFYGTVANKDWYSIDDATSVRPEKLDNGLSIPPIRITNDSIKYVGGHILRRYLKDTNMVVLGKKTPCYVFESIYKKIFLGATIRKVEFISKKNLIPVLVKKYYYHTLGDKLRNIYNQILSIPYECYAEDFVYRVSHEKK